MLDQEDYLAKVKPLVLSKVRSREDSAFLSAEEATGFRSLLCSLLGVVQTRMDLAHDVVRLQTEMVCPQFLRAKEVNNLSAEQPQRLATTACITGSWPFPCAPRVWAMLATRARSPLTPMRARWCC